VQLPQYVRIGLTQRHNEQARITVGSPSIEIGYSIGYSFIPAASLSAQASFAVVPTNGHFVRLSQTFGSFSAARDYAAIPNSVPVLIDRGMWAVYIVGLDEHSARNHADGSFISASTSRIALMDGDRVVPISENTSAMMHLRSTNGQTALGDRQYRGILEIGRFAGRNVTAVNIVNMEEYLFSVVPSEMPASWHIEALKAQATAARTYTVRRQHAHSAQGFSLCDTEHCQVYHGIGREHYRSTQAVNATRGRLILFNGEPIEAVYFSSSGGITANSEDVWVNPRPYLRAVADIHEITGRVWSRTFTLSQLTYLMNRQNVSIGQVQAVQTITRSGRVQELIFVGSSGSHRITHENIRWFFSPIGSLYSRNFFIEGTAQAQQAFTPGHPGPAAQLFVTNGFAVNESIPSVLRSVNAANALNSLPITASVVSASSTTQLNLTASPSAPLITADTTTATSTGYTITLHGRGWGHGVGMSQHGAHNMAQAGYTFEQILRWYYTGVEIR